MSVFNESFYLINCSRTLLFVPNAQTNGSVYVIICLLLIISFPVVIMNVYIVGITCYFRNMRSVSNTLLAIISFWDLLVGIFSIIPMILILILSISHAQKCGLLIFSMFTNFLFGLISFLTVFLSSIDRYLATFKPFFYQKHLNENSRFYIKCASVIAILVLLIMCISFTLEKKLKSLFIMSIAPIVIIIVLYIHTRLHIQVKLVRRKISSLDPNFNGSNFSKNKCTIKNLNASTKKEVRKNLKINKFTIMVYASTCFSYLPFVVLLYLVQLYSNSLIWKWTRYYYLWAYMLTLTKPLANPIIYFYRSRILRRSLNRVRQSLSKSNPNVGE
ncbi:D(1A) dopamine receptor [Hydra vulgaris]|uniref:D(1A) dopamine receptor n=1 Tax=Hydra vulgaris TaxID=6087 RepID=UPI001F5FE8D2|nr:D(1A) dopamine receptor-like [Hydra vulgaris]